MVSHCLLNSSSGIGLKGALQSRKWNHNRACCVYLCTFWIEDLWVNWNGGEADGGRDAGTENWDQSPAPIAQQGIEEVTRELWQLLSKLAYLKRLAAFYLSAFPRFFQFVCFWNPEWVSTAGEGRKTSLSSAAKYEVHEDLEYENEDISSHVSFQLQWKGFCIFFCWFVCFC